MKGKKITAWGIMAICTALMQMAACAASAQPLDFRVIAGQWSRIDGNYTLRVQDVISDGKVNVSYFNPGESRIICNVHWHSDVMWWKAVSWALPQWPDCTPIPESWRIWKLQKAKFQCFSKTSDINKIL